MFEFGVCIIEQYVTLMSVTLRFYCLYRVCVCVVSCMYRVCVLLASEQSERAQSCSCSIEISDTYVYICIYMWPYVNLYAHARWYVMWEELSVNHFHKHSNQLKPTLKMF